MKLKRLIDAPGVIIKGAGDPVVLSLALDSREVTPGALFFAMPGHTLDGTAFIDDALLRGAVAIVAGQDVSAKVVSAIVPDVREALSKAADVFYGEPTRHVKVVGITGTNGKTTTTYLVESILRQSGHNPGVIGTVNWRYAGKVSSSTHTTPSAIALQGILAEMRSGGVTHCVMEVSSHALDQKRADACRFAVALFTNLTHEHLDYHKTMDAYYASKARLFELTLGNNGACVVNVDDEWGGRLKRDFPASLTYSLSKGADICPRSYELLEDRTIARIYTPAGEISLESHLVGDYNLQNILAAIGAGVSLGLGADDIGKGVSALRSVRGRLEKLSSPTGFNAYVDYAHTGDALERALLALRKIAAGRVITVFGCGGNRDRTKRPIMGEIAGRLSDIVIVTTDNPRDEEPREIIREIEAGLSGVKKCDVSAPCVGPCYMVVPDRGEAIRKAVSMAEKGDTLLVAGKGHEDYQIVKGLKSHFDDAEELRRAFDMAS